LAVVAGVCFLGKYQRMAGVVDVAALAALGAALCWAVTPLLSVVPAERLGSIGFVRWRMYTALLFLGLVVPVTGRWSMPSGNDFLALSLSGCIGIFLGDSFLFASMNIVGPRLSSLLFSTHAAITAMMAVIFLHETITPILILAFGLVTCGVMTATIFGRAKNNAHLWEKSSGALFLGIVFGLLAAICQAVGAVLVKPALARGLDPIVASMFRIAAAAFFHTIARFALPELTKNRGRLTPKILLQTGLGSVLAMGAGMSLLMFAFAHGDVAWSATLSSISPILILPLLWIHYKKSPAPGAWIGAAITFFGTALILLRHSS